MSRAKRERPTRRAWGGGSVQERAPGQWIIRLSGRTDPMTGKRTRETRVVWGTRRQAESELRKLVSERAAHGPTPTTAASLTLDAWVRQHIETAELSERTRRAELDLWERYSTPVLRALPLRDVTTAALDAHMNALRGRTSAHTKRPLSPRTRQLFFNVVRAALTAAVRTKRLAVNPATGVEVRGGNGVSKASAALSPAEMRTLLAHDPEDRLHPLWYVAGHTGMRPGELLGLWWEDIDFTAGTIPVARALTEGPDGAPVYGPCKAGSARTLHVGDLPEVLAVLQRHRKRQLEERMKLGERWADPRVVFASEIGTPLDRHNIAARFRRKCTAAGLRAVRWYDLRHSVGSMLIAEGVDAKTVSEILGHRDVRTTLAHYVHPSAEQKRTALGKLAHAGARAGSA